MAKAGGVYNSYELNTWQRKETVHGDYYYAVPHDLPLAAYDGRASSQAIFLWTFLARHISGNLDKETSGEDEWLASDAPKAALADAAPTFFSTSGQEALVRELFEIFDTEGKGRLGKAELASAIYAMGFNTRRHHDIASAVLGDPSQDGAGLSLEQFTELIRGKLAGRDPDERIMATFAWLCGDVGGKRKWVNYSTLKQRVRKLKIRLSDEELMDMVREADRDGDGNVDAREYLLMLKNSTWI